MENKKDKFYEIVDLTIEIEKLGADVFIRYAGHVKTIDIDIYEDGWETNKEPIFSKTAYINWEYSCHYISLDELIEELRNLYRDLENKRVKDKTYPAENIL